MGWMGQLLGGGRGSSLWRRDVYKLCSHEWFSDHVSPSVGKGNHTLFWTDVWLGGVRFVSGLAVPPQVLPDYFIQFSYIGRSEKVWRPISQDIWFATVWEIWKERNNRLFMDKTCSTLQVADKIKSLTFMWPEGEIHYSSL
ncbi:hypothetical protein MTR_2g089320 [Medicago truncatula]|uniref:Reverse transcriptase zinc-binding domain-containing protein n=1 Tax=Medicago truncatula TaxID=3880 RepID=G7IRL1_MEDTR|nr:hypothetical protein MTR_2g089320 [Medicago truncatula]